MPQDDGRQAWPGMQQCKKGEVHEGQHRDRVEPAFGLRFVPHAHRLLAWASTSFTASTTAVGWSSGTQ